MPAIETKRLFIAIEIPENIKTYLAAIQKELKTSGADAKWVEPENIHLTLKFLGSVEIGRIKNLEEVLIKRFHQTKQFKMTLNQLGAFPSISSCRVLWAGLDDRTDNLKNIALGIDEEFSKLGFEKEAREFQAHATLARIRSSRNKIALIEKIKHAQENLKIMDFTIDNLTLFESRLSPKGPTYSIIHQIKFLQA